MVSIQQELKNMQTETHYDKKYFDWQKQVGEFGGTADLFKFKDFINTTDNVIDFGCGGGYLLKNITSKNKIGVEINDEARKIAQKNGIPTVKFSGELPDDWADVIISNHALEHIENPIEELRILIKKLRKGGRVVFVVPHERKNKYTPNDINQHLYTWSEMNLGNLFTRAGFHVIKVETIDHRWMPGYIFIRKTFGDDIFNFLCKIYAYTHPNISQIRIVGEKT